MPMFRCGALLIHFAHVPKSAGSSIEDYLSERFGPAGFLNRDFNLIPESERWTATSPQHLSAADFAALFPKGYFDASFAVVREPLARFVSAFHFHQKRTGYIPPRFTLGLWIGYMGSRFFPGHARFDNHFLPQSEMVPDDATVFRLEDGLEPVVTYLDGIVGNTDGPRRIGHVNAGSDSGAVSLTDPQKRRLRAYYSADYKRFGYGEAAS